jgi:hypothetical protein
MTPQLELLDLPPTRLQDVTLRDWDTGKHQALYRQLYHRAPMCICITWWLGIMGTKPGPRQRVLARYGGDSRKERR